MRREPRCDMTWPRAVLQGKGLRKMVSPQSPEGPTKKVVGIFQGGVGSQILMLQDIKRQKSGKLGSKFGHGGGGYQKQPKQIRHLLWTAPYLPNCCKEKKHGLSQIFFCSSAPADEPKGSPHFSVSQVLCRKC